MTKVLFASHDSNFGGAQNVLHALVVALREKGITPIVTYPADGPGAQRSRDAELDTRILPVEWWTHVGCSELIDPLAGFLKGLRMRVDAFASLIEKESVDVVFTNTSVILAPALASRLTRRPHIWHVLEMLSQDAELCSAPVGEFAKRIIAGTGNRVIAVSEGVRQELNDHVPSQRLQVIHTGIDLAQFSGAHAPGEHKRLLFLGLFSERKGIRDLFMAIGRVVQATPDIDLYLAGQEAQFTLASLLEMIPEAYRGRVHYLGFRKDIPELLRASDALVLPSLADPLPVSVLEAMAAGLPVIGTRSGGMEDQIVDGETGRLVPVGRPDMLAAAILDVFSDMDRARRMGAAARRCAETEFSLDHMANEFAKVISEVGSEQLKPMSPAGLANTQACLNMMVSFGRQLTEQGQALSGLEQIAKLLEAERDKFQNELIACRHERERYKIGLEMLMNKPYIRAGRAVKGFARRLLGRKGD